MFAFYSPFGALRVGAHYFAHQCCTDAMKVKLWPPWEILTSAQQPADGNVIPLAILQMPLTLAFVPNRECTGAESASRRFRSMEISGCGSTRPSYPGFHSETLLSPWYVLEDRCQIPSLGRVVHSSLVPYQNAPGFRVACVDGTNRGFGALVTAQLPAPIARLGKVSTTRQRKRWQRDMLIPLDTSIFTFIGGPT